jgi:hypothetical protein
MGRVAATESRSLPLATATLPSARRSRTKIRRGEAGRQMSSVSFKSRSPDLRRRFLAIATVVLALIVIGVGATFFAINRAIESGSAPVHRFPVSSGESFLTNDRAAAIAREVMNRDGFPESAWRLMNDDRTKAPYGRPDQFLTRNTINLDQGCVSFHCESSPTPDRFVNIELRDGEITAQGSLGK